MVNQPLLIIGPDIQSHGIGGVTIHVQRLRECLDIKGINYRFSDYKTVGFTSLLNKIFKARIIHFHISNPFFLIILVLFAKLLNKTILLTLHGNYGRFGRLKNFMMREAICMSTVPIVINEESYERCRRINKNTQFIPAFIPPQKDVFLQVKILEMVENLHMNGKKIVSTNASTVSFDKFGNEIYGIDFLVNFFKNDNIRTLIVSDPSGNYRRRYINLQSDSVIFIDYPHPYYELLKHVDYFVRNTSTDGDAISVKEALFLGVPTFCSNVVERPNGTVLFHYSDSKSFETCFECHCTIEKKIESGADALVSLYKKLLACAK